MPRLRRSALPYHGADRSEIMALIDLYNATGGPSWTDNTNWLTAADVSTWNGVTTAGGHITEIDLNTNNLVGAIPNVFGDLPYLTDLDWAVNTLSGSLINLPTSLTYLYCTGNSITTLDASALTSLTYLNCGSNSITTLDVSALTSLTTLRCDSNSITTLDVSALTSLTYLRCDSNSITTLDVSALGIGLEVVQCQNNGMNQAAVDTIIGDIYANRASYTDATPELNVGGTNATPSGIYQSVCPATTALEEVHNLATDGCTEGHNTWTVTWNGGSAP